MYSIILVQMMKEVNMTLFASLMHMIHLGMSLLSWFFTQI